MTEAPRAKAAIAAEIERTQIRCLGCGAMFVPAAPEIPRCAKCVRAIFGAVGDLNTAMLVSMMHGAQANPGGWKPAVTVSDVIATLNELLNLDQRAISELVRYRVRVNPGIIHHPAAKTKPEEDGHFYLGFLGLLNAIIGIEDGAGAVNAEQPLTESGMIGKFMHTSEIPTENPENQVESTD